MVLLSGLLLSKNQEAYVRIVRGRQIYGFYIRLYPLSPGERPNPMAENLDKNLGFLQASVRMLLFRILWRVWA